MKKIISLYFILQCTLCYSQNNLIPNYSFEDTNPNHYIPDITGNCCGSYQYANSNNGEENFNGDIAFWKYARHGNSHRKLPIWVDQANTNLPFFQLLSCSCAPMFNTFPSNRIILLNAEYDYNNNCSNERYAAIRNGFEPQIPLSTNTVYTLRFKYASFAYACENLICNNQAVLSIYLTTFAYNWDSKDSDNQSVWVDDFSTNCPTNGCQWKLYEQNFILAPSADNLLNIIFICNEQGFLIDDVELFEKCPSEKNIQNKFYLGGLNPNSDYVESAENNLYAGCCIIQNQNFGDVLVESGSSVKFTAGEQISILPGFHAENGSEFSASIVPCSNNKSQSIENPTYEKVIIPNVFYRASKSLEKDESGVWQYNNSVETFISISPNPVNNMLFIDGLALPALVSVFDISGNKILSSNLNENRIDISGLAQGLYFIKFFTPEGNIVRKFVKE